MNKTHAFPGVSVEETETPYVQAKVYSSGMTLRDYFAAKVVQNYLGNLPDMDACKKAYSIADMMLKARKEWNAHVK